MLSVMTNIYLMGKEHVEELVCLRHAETAVVVFPSTQPLVML